MNDVPAGLEKWAIPQKVVLEQGPGGLPRIAVSTALATAEVYLHGAHVSAYQPAGSRPVLFMSAASQFAPGKPIRGGVPLIFPWFGALSGHPELPVHGFARTFDWEVESLSCEQEVVEIVLSLSSSPQTRALWPHEFIVRHRIRIGSTLEMTLEVENLSAESFSFEEAFHTYFAIGDIHKVAVSGLESAGYIDNLAPGTLKVESPEALTFTAETDRKYLDTSATCRITDPLLQREILVRKEHSQSTVVWNPWIAKARAMADFGDGEWPGMLCIETANAAKNAVTLAPGAVHHMRALIQTAPLAV